MVYGSACPNHHRSTLAKLGPVARDRQPACDRPGCPLDNVQPATGISRAKTERVRNESVTERQQAAGQFDRTAPASECPR